VIPLREDNATRLTDLLEEIAATAHRQFEAEGVPTEQMRLIHYAKMRYENQEHSVEIPLPDGAIDSAAVAEIAATFHELYEREYTYRLEAPIEVVGAHIVAIAEIGKLTPSKLPVSGRPPLEDARKGARDVDYATEGHHLAEIYDGALLEPGMSFEGPAVVETSGSTTVIHVGNSVTVDEYGNLQIAIRSDNA
jgi:N-methylhydantoinase A